MPTRQQPPAARVVNGQTYSQRRRRYSGAIMAGAIAASRASLPAAGVALAMPQCWQPVATSGFKPEMVHPTAPIRLRLSRERLGVFLALAQVEQRPLEDVLAEHVADTAGRLLRTRHELHLDPDDAKVLAEYIDGLAGRQEA